MYLNCISKVMFLSPTFDRIFKSIFHIFFVSLQRKITLGLTEDILIFINKNRSTGVLSFVYYDMKTQLLRPLMIPCDFGLVFGGENATIACSSGPNFFILKSLEDVGFELRSYRGNTTTSFSSPVDLPSVTFSRNVVLKEHLYNGSFFKEGRV